jgi:signal transduction histidine kinase/CheY-like chemotaxis protein
MILRNRSIKLKIIFITALSSCIALVAFSFILFFYETTFVKRDLISNLQTQVEIIAENSLASLAFMDDSTTRKTLGALKHNPDVLYAGLYNQQQQLLDAYRKEIYHDQVLFQEGEIRHAPHLKQIENLIEIVQPVYLNGDILGYLVLRANFASLNQKLQDYMGIILVAFCVTLFIALYLSLYLQRIVSHPIIRLANFIHHITDSKSYYLQVTKESNDEFGRVVDAFNEMLTQLNVSFEKRDEAENALSHHLSHLQDIVDEQTLDLQKALQAADMANHSKSEFLANMSHEIRTPMNAIMGMTHLAQRTNLSGKQKDYLNKIDSAAQLLLTIINDILDFSKIEAGKLSLENIEFSVEKVFEHLNNILKIKADQKNVRLKFVMAPDMPRYFIGDSLRLGQILINLVSNAIKFTERGDVIVSVKQKNADEKTTELCFSVQDSGIGMNLEQIDALFQPFAQADTSTTRKYGGTGLGLTISKQLAELMGSDISVTSVLGQGSCFSFSVVLERSSNQTVHADALEKIDNFYPYYYSTQRILLVEDNEINQQVAMELLGSMNLGVIVAKNGQEGVRLALTEPFDLIFMDVQMPVMDGLTATRLIRAEPALKTLPIVAMTAHAMQGDKEKSLAAGMNDHLTKPINMEKLTGILNRWLKVDAKMIRQPIRVIVNNLPMELPPFDLAQAAKFSGDNLRLLHQLLLSFASRYENSMTQLKQWLSEKEFTQMEYLAHSIKGMAGTLAAEDLRQAAAELESAIHGEKFENLDLLVSNLTEALTAAINATTLLPPLLNEYKLIETERLNEEELSELLTEWHEALSGNHFKALELFEQLKLHLHFRGFDKEIQELVVHLDSLDFQAALLVLERINFCLQR